MPEEQPTLIESRKQFAKAAFDLYFSLSGLKQGIIILAFMAFCAVGFQVIHGFNLLCKWSGGMACIATEYTDKPDPVLIAVQYLTAKVDKMDEKQMETSKRIFKIEKTVDLLADLDGTKEKIRRRLIPHESLFGVIHN